MANFFFNVDAIRGFWLRRDHPNYITMPTLIVDIVGVAIAVIPEGLPITLTAGLTITAKLMRKNKVLVQATNGS